MHRRRGRTHRPRSETFVIVARSISMGGLHNLTLRKRPAPVAFHTPQPPTSEPDGVIPGTIGETRARDHDWARDVESHTCCCGHQFTASVTAGTACPACGDGQPW